jgi:hypothetical protein
MVLSLVFLEPLRVRLLQALENPVEHLQEVRRVRLLEEERDAEVARLGLHVLATALGEDGLVEPGVVVVEHQRHGHLDRRFPGRNLRGEREYE